MYFFSLSKSRLPHRKTVLRRDRSLYTVIYILICIQWFYMCTHIRTHARDSSKPGLIECCHNNITHPREERLIAVWFCRKFMVDKSAAKGGTRLPKMCANDVIRTDTTTGRHTHARRHTYTKSKNY